MRKDYKDYYLGQKKMMNCGLEAEIIEYRNSKAITVRFSDGSIKVPFLNKFRTGMILHPSLIYRGYYRVKTTGNRVINHYYDSTIGRYRVITETKDGTRSIEVLQLGGIFDGK